MCIYKRADYLVSVVPAQEITALVAHNWAAGDCHCHILWAAAAGDCSLHILSVVHMPAPALLLASSSSLHYHHVNTFRVMAMAFLEY